MRALAVATMCLLAVTARDAAAQSCPSSGNPNGLLPSAALNQSNMLNPTNSMANVDPSSDPALAALSQQSYGGTATQTANQLGVNPVAVAEIGNAESGFRNIPTANGSSSATGPWQITGPTFQGISQQNSLGFTPADQTNPQAQAVEASYIVRDYATAVSNAIGQPATVVQAYGAYIYGPNAGANMANLSPSSPLSAAGISDRALANNGMSGWTVGQFYNTMSQRLGPNANQPALVAT